MAVREWYLGQAVHSYASLRSILDELTEEEVLAALTLESGTLRRRSITDRLVSRAVRLNELSYKRNLLEKYHGKSPRKDPC